MLSASRSHRRPGGPDLERHEHWRGQLLKSRDLSDQQSDAAERQWWHNRSLHDAYGIAAGLAVTSRPDGRPGLAVSRGLAYDAYGRELLLTEPALVPPPRGAGEGRSWLLLLAAAGGAARARPALLWRQAGRAGLKDGVPLARGRWSADGSELFFDRDDGFRPAPARPLARPHLGEGSTPAGKTAWRRWEVAFTSAFQQLPLIARGIEVTVDTAAAGFTTTPCYFGWLQGGLWQVPQRLARTLPLERITDPARDRFTFSLWDPVASRRSPGDNEVDRAAEALLGELLSLARDRLFVCWLGVEPAPSRPASLRRKAALAAPARPQIHDFPIPR